jgi:hypothetical protein
MAPVGRGRVTARGPVKLHRPRRRVHPARLQRWFLEVPEEERLQEYWRRWRSFEYALAAFREGLARTVDSFASAEARLLGVDPSAGAGGAGPGARREVRSEVLARSAVPVAR